LEIRVDSLGIHLLWSPSFAHHTIPRFRYNELSAYSKVGWLAKKHEMNDTSGRLTFLPGDHVRISCGSVFDGYQGVVAEQSAQDGFVRFSIMVFGRPVELVLEPSKLESIRTNS
jgi:transcription antitermination factor NusG